MTQVPVLCGYTLMQVHDAAGGMHAGSQVRSGNLNLSAYHPSCKTNDRRLSS